MSYKSILFVILLSCCQVSINARGTNQSVIKYKDFYSLMHQIDKLHAPYKKRYYKIREESRRKFVPQSTMETISASDTIDIILCISHDGSVTDYFEESVFCDIACYYIVSPAYVWGKYITDTGLMKFWDTSYKNLLHNILDKNYTISKTKEAFEARRYDELLYIRLIRIDKDKFKYTCDLLYEDGFTHQLYMLKPEQE